MRGVALSVRRTRSGGRGRPCVVGDRSEAKCQKLWESIPEAYRSCQSYNDFWAAYASVFPRKTHQQVDRKSGQLAYIRRWHNISRQKPARYVRKTLAFSKSKAMHEGVARWFVIT